jgi:protein SCO1/2
MRAAKWIAVLGLVAIAAVLAAGRRTPPPRAIGAADQKPAEYADVDIEEKPGAKWPSSIGFRDHAGREVTLAKYLDGERPIVLVLAYYRCPMLCSLVLNGLFDGLAKLDSDEWTAGKKFRVVVVSFDPRDGVAEAHDKRESYVGKYAREHRGAELGDDNGIEFLVGTPAAVKVLADNVGFRYRWDEKTQQFAHTAGAFVFTRDGRLSRTLYGMQFPSETLRLALAEASQGKLGSVWDKVLLFCYHYDPVSRGYVANAWQVMRVGGVLTLAALALFLAVLWRRRSSPPTAAP